MKKIIVLVILLAPFVSFAQNGAVIKDTLKLNDGSYYVKGTSIDIGPGSKSDGGYAFISVKGTMAPLIPGWSGYKMKIIDFFENGNETMGKKYYLVLVINKSKMGKYLCDPALAKEKGEIK